jgi:hypothetical protein
MHQNSIIHQNRFQGENRSAFSKVLGMAPAQVFVNKDRLCYDNRSADTTLCEGRRAKSRTTYSIGGMAWGAGGLEKAGYWFRF